MTRKNNEWNRNCLPFRSIWNIKRMFVIFSLSIWIKISIVTAILWYNMCYSDDLVTWLSCLMDGVALITWAPEFTPAFKWCSCYSIFSFMCMLCWWLFFNLRILSTLWYPQTLLALLNHLSSPSVFSVVRVARVFCVLFCRSLLPLLPFLLWPFYCLSFFGLQLLFIPLVFLNI